MDIESAAWKDFYYLKQQQEYIEDKFIFMYICYGCNSDQLYYNQTLDETTCTNCGLVLNFNIHYQRNQIEYLPDTSNVIHKSVYKHLDYFNRKIDELSCARIYIKPKLLSEIKKELNGKTATLKLLCKILRKLGHKQKFLQIPTILNTLYPEEYPPIKLDFHQRNLLENMFLLYIDTFFLLRNRGIIKRKNLLNYNFVFFKLFNYLKLERKVHYFQMPKGKKTIENHEIIWDLIFKFNKW
jgi:ribosomal protein S27E